MKIRALFMVSLVLIVLMGCKGGGKDSDKSPFIGGTNGVLLGFVSNFPPDEVYDGGDDPFDIFISLKNDGEYDIPAGELTVKISGIQGAEFGKSGGGMSASLASQLDGKKKSSEGDPIPGGEETIEFKGFNHVQELTGTNTYPLRADVSYLYGTTATAKLCYKKNLRTADEGVCSTEGSKTVFNSGAPVQVSELSEYVKGSGAIGFRFKVSLSGNGMVCRHSIKDCTDAQYSDRELVYVDVKTNENGLVCKGFREGSATAGFVRLSEGYALVQCDQPSNAETDFEKPVDIFLKYRYSEDLSTTLVVKHQTS